MIVIIVMISMDLVPVLFKYANKHLNGNWTIQNIQEHIRIHRYTNSTLVDMILDNDISWQFKRAWSGTLP